MVAGMLAGCQRPEPQRARKLRVLADSLVGAQHQLENPTEEEAAEAFAWADAQYREFNLLLDDGTITISKEEGGIISEVSRARRLLKDQAKRRTALPKGASRAQSQLHALADAIASGAAKDAAGNTIDDAYIDREIQTESRIARDLIAAMTETQSLALRGIALKESIEIRSDSLQTVCRARLARAILEGTVNAPVE